MPFPKPFIVSLVLIAMFVSHCSVRLILNSLKITFLIVFRYLSHLTLICRAIKVTFINCDVFDAFNLSSRVCAGFNVITGALDFNVGDRTTSPWLDCFASPRMQINVDELRACLAGKGIVLPVPPQSFVDTIAGHLNRLLIYGFRMYVAGTSSICPFCL